VKPLILTDCSRNKQVTIVISNDAGPVIQSTAEELRYYLVKLSGSGYGTVGTKIDISSNVANPTGLCIFLGLSQHTDKLGISTADLGPEGYRIKRVDDALVLLGADDVGTGYAVSHFLQEVCGVRWFWPGDSGEDVPKNASIVIEDLDVTESPDFQMRLFSSPSDLRQEAAWVRRNRLGGTMEIVGTHSFGLMVPPDRHGPDHPEYFALVDGERTWRDFNGKHGCQLCTTHPDVLALCIEYVRDFFDAHPSGMVFNISPNDGGGFCECPACVALDSGETCTIHNQHVPCVSGQIFTFANKIGEAIAQSHPGRYVAVLAYHQYLDPPPQPGFRLHPSVIVQLCLNCDMDYDAAHLTESNAIMDKWKAVADKKAIYEYLVWRGSAELPRTLHTIIPDAIRRYHAAGARLYATQAIDDFMASSLNYYLAARVLWDVHADTDAIIDDFFKRCFGEAEGPMRCYYELLDQRWQHALRIVGSAFYSGSPTYYLEMFTPEVLKTMAQLLDEAAAAADSARVSQRIMLFKNHFQYTKATMDALRSLQDLARIGAIYLSKAWPTHIEDRPDDTQGTFTAEWEEIDAGQAIYPFSDEALADSSRTGELLDAGLDAWNYRNGLVESLRETPVIDYWHIRLDVDRDYHFDPTDRLIAIKSSFEKLLNLRNGEPGNSRK
jgi:hypothetical protein